MADGNGWNEYQQLVLNTLKRQEAALQRLDEKFGEDVVMPGVAKKRRHNAAKGENG